MAFYTKAAKKYAESITAWLQDTRLMSEAVFRLYGDYKQEGRIIFSEPSWPKLSKSSLPPSSFAIQPIPLAQRMDVLLKSLWKAQFVFLESLWEEYLQDLVLELRHKDVGIFDPFCEQKFMAGIVRDVLAGKLESIEEIKDEAAARFAAGITRQPWKEQWNQLARLGVGLNKENEKEPWFRHLDTYFEMRNCVIHRQGKVSSLLEQKEEYYLKNGKSEVEIWPQHLDFYRNQFKSCLNFIEDKIRATYSSKSTASANNGMQPTADTKVLK
jgi:hypothetical protein